MPLSSFPNGFAQGVAIRGVPLAVGHPGKVFFVNNSSVLAPNAIGASDGNDGSYKRPFSTIAGALLQCTASRGDIVFVMPGHAETISGAAGIDLNVAGVAVIGLTQGTIKPTITFSATASTLAISAANCSLANVILTPSVDQVVTALNVTGSDAYIDIESKDAAANKEFVTVLTTSATADRLDAKIKHNGFTTGTHMTALCSLVGTDRANLNIDFYGKASTAVVNFVTTASLGVNIRGVMHNAAGAISYLAVDTITGSKYNLDVMDSMAGAQVRGGSGLTVGSSSAAGGELLVTKTLTSSAILQTGVDVTGVSSGGGLFLKHWSLRTNGTGLAAGTNFTLETNNALGGAVFASHAVGSLGANVLIDMKTATTGKATYLESGKKIIAKCTVADCTGAGTIAIDLLFNVGTTGATIAAA